VQLDISKSLNNLWINKMAQKCRTGQRIRNGRCVSKSHYNILSPQETLNKVFLWGLIIGVIVSALVASSFLLFGEFNETTLRILLTVITLSAVSLLCLVSGSAENQALRWSGVISAFAAGLLYILIIWGSFSFQDETMFRITIIATILAVALAHISLLLRFRGSDDMITLVVFWIVAGLVVVVAGMLGYLVIIKNVGDVGMTYFRILGFLGVLDLAGTIVLPILKKVRG